MSKDVVHVLFYTTKFTAQPSAAAKKKKNEYRISNKEPKNEEVG